MNTCIRLSLSPSIHPLSLFSSFAFDLSLDDIYTLFLHHLTIFSCSLLVIRNYQDVELSPWEC